MLIADAATVKLTEFVHGRRGNGDVARSDKNVNGIVNSTLSDKLASGLVAKD